MINYFNKKMIRGILIIFCITVAGLLFFILGEQKNSVSRQLAQDGLNIQGAEQFIVTESGVDYFTGEHQGEIMRVKIMRNFSTEEAQRYRDEQAALLEGLFVSQLPPYPEFLMQESACGEKYQPIKKETEFGIYYVLFANDRFGYGVCADDLIAHRAGFGLFYCPAKRTMATIEIFGDAGASVQNIEEFLTSFGCDR